MHYNTPIPSDQNSSSFRRARFQRVRALLADSATRQRLLFVASLVALALVMALGALARLLVVLPLDVWFTREAQEHTFTLLVPAMRFVSLFGYAPWSAISVAAITLIISITLGWRDALFVAAITVLQGLANAAIKLAIGRPRPMSGVVDVIVAVNGNSFPSGHVMFYTVLFGFVGYLAFSRLPRSLLRWAALMFCAALVLLVGPSRILLGAHWLSDVVAAYLLGVIMLGFGIEFYEQFVRSLSPNAHE